MDDATIASAITVRLARARAGGTRCPSEVARDLASEGRPLLPHVRAVAAEMPEVVATQKGQPVNPLSAKGPIRLGRRK